MNPKKTLTVEDLRMVNAGEDAAFRVVKVQNSLNYRIGELLSRRDIENRCTKNWTVNVVPKK